VADEILTSFDRQIESLTLIPSDGGRFEVEVDGELIFSKLALKRHAEAGEIPLLLRQYFKERV